MADNETRFLSKIKLNGVIYNLKDDRLATLLGEHTLEALGAAAWQSVASTITEGVEGLAKATDVKAYVDSQVGKVHNFDVIIDSTGTSSGPSITASEDTMYKIYMVPDTGASAGVFRLAEGRAGSAAVSGQQSAVDWHRDAEGDALCLVYG